MSQDQLFDPGYQPRTGKQDRRAGRQPATERVCGIAFCTVTFPAHGLKLYCNQSHAQLANRRPDLVQGTDWVTIVCEWCGDPAPNQRSALMRRGYRWQRWGYVCSECIGPVLAVKASLDKHNVPINEVRRLAKNGTCDLCGRQILNMSKSDSLGRRHGVLHVDHDHDCCPGKHSCGQCFRGFLCADCNPRVTSSPEFHDRVAAYLRSYQQRRR